MTFPETFNLERLEGRGREVIWGELIRGGFETTVYAIKIMGSKIIESIK
jgi:hypothetical protein